MTYLGALRTMYLHMYIYIYTWYILAIHQIQVWPFTSYKSIITPFMEWWPHERNHMYIYIYIYAIYLSYPSNTVLALYQLQVSYNTIYGIMTP